MIVVPVENHHTVLTNVIDWIFGDKKYYTLSELQYGCYLNFGVSIKFIDNMLMYEFESNEQYTWFVLRWS